MKKIKQLSKILLLAAIYSFCFTSCSSDSDGGSVNAGEGTITAKVNGTTVTSTPMATFAYLTDLGLQITGSDTSAKNLAINIVAFQGVGKYEMGGDNTRAIGTYTEVDLNNPQNLNNLWIAPFSENMADGFVDITEVTATHVKGTFSFEAKNQAGVVKSITNGSFNIKTKEM